MALTDHFSGTNLDSSWTFFQGNPANCTASVSNSQLSVTLPALTAYDGFNNGSVTPTAPSIKQSMSDVNFDVAYLSGSVPNTSIQGSGFHIDGSSGNDAVRTSVYYTATGIRAYCISRVGGTSTVRFNGSAPGAWNQTHGGFPAWQRLRRTGTSWDFYISSDGTNWTLVVSFTETLVVSSFGIEFISAGAGLPGYVARIEKTVDMLVYPNPHDALETMVISEQWLADFNSGMPSWLSDSSVGGGTAVVSAGLLTLGSISSTNGSSGRVTFNDAPMTDSEILMRFRTNTSPTGSREFIVAGLQASGAEIDHYTVGQGYIAEHNNYIGTVRTIRTCHPSVGNSDNEAPYSFLLMSTGVDQANNVWFWLRFQRIGLRVRHKYWRNSVSEPVGWFYDGEDRSVSFNGGVPWLSWSHNDNQNASTSTDTVDIDYLEINKLSVADRGGWGIRA